VQGEIKVKKNFLAKLKVLKRKLPMNGCYNLENPR